MGTDVPVPLASLLAPNWGVTPQSAVALLVGLLASLASGFMVYVAVTARIARITLRSEVVRALVGALLALVAAVFLVWLGFAASGGTAGLANTLALLAMALGLALIFPVAGAVLAATTASRPEGGGLAYRAGTLMAEVLAGWAVKVKNGNGNGSIPNDEPEFEITMASGEEVDAEEREYIENILELSDTTAHEVMTPRTDVVALDAAWEPERVVSTVADSRFSRFPVYEDNIDNVTGVLHLRDLLEFLARGEGVDRLDLRSILMAPYFVPSSKKVDDVLRELQVRKGHMAVVLDEFGGTAGILTIEDLLEEIVGEIQDEYDDESKPVHQRADGSWVVDAQVSLDDLGDALRTGIAAEDVDTLGGFIVQQLGHIPFARETIEYGDLRLTVLSVDKNRVSRVLVERSDQAESTH